MLVKDGVILVSGGRIRNPISLDNLTVIDQQGRFRRFAGRKKENANNINACVTYLYPDLNHIHQPCRNRKTPSLAPL